MGAVCCCCQGWHQRWVGALKGKVSSFKTTDIQGRSQNLRHFFIPAWGSNWGSSGFSVIKITLVRQVCMSPTSTAVCGIKINTRKTPQDVGRSWMRLFCLCLFWGVWSAKIWRPTWLTMPLHGVIDESGISFLYLCWRHTYVLLFRENLPVMSLYHQTWQWVIVPPDLFISLAPHTISCCLWCLFPTSCKFPAFRQGNN